MLRTRRQFIAQSAAIALSMGTAGNIAAAEDVRIIELLALHTNEYLRMPFRAGGELLNKNLPSIDHLLRDHRTDEVHAIDPLLLDYLHDLADALDLTVPFHVVSGFRSASTNEQLRRTSSGVAKRSFHLVGRAVDVRVPDMPVAQVREAAIALHRGGVGYYPRSGFVHLDTGRFRHW